MGTSLQNHGMFVLVAIVSISWTVSNALPTPLAGCPVVECSGSSNVFSFEPQHTYIYKFEASSENILSGATTPSGGPSGKLHLTATAELQAVSPCQFGLAISQVQVVGADGKKHSSLSGLEGNAIQLALDDGQLQSELCTDTEEGINSLNLKRAIASLLQVATSSQQLTDIFGDCPVEISTSVGGEGVTMINSRRDLNKCQRRENIISDIPVSSYLLNSDTQAAPILKASAKMQQRVKGGILEASTTHEEYSYRPFSNQGSGAVVSVHTSLILQSQSAKISFTAPSSPKLESVVFEPPHGPGNDKSSAENLIKTLKAACDSMPNEASSDAAKSIHQLVQLMRQSSKDDLLSVYGEVRAGAGIKNKKDARKVYLDALLHTASGEAVEVIAELIKNKEIEEPLLFYSSLAFTRHATGAAVRSVTSLLEQGNPPRELVLGAGSLAGHYFEQHGRTPTKDIESLLLKIARPLKNCQPKGHEQENKVVSALKGLHNAHYIPDSVADKIKECATNKKASSRVRAAALDSMQGDPSNKKLKQIAYDILKDVEEDSELRIKAYLMIVSCPCGEVANFVQTLLDSEPVNQVGSFIVSHLRNVKASSNPEKEDTRKYLGNIRIPANKFALDARKYSSNTELSYSLGQANAAASAEANVIFSQDSFLPRFTSLNVTTNLFGHSFNLFEVGLRAENLEHILESYFGPKGYFSTHSANELIKTSSDKVTTLSDKIKARARKAFRGRRSLARTDVDKMDKKVQMHDDEEDNINIDAYLKLFGAELAFLSYYGDPSSMSPSALVDRIFDGVDSIINKAKDYSYILKEHIVLFDSELVYPTATGFPLKLSASSTAALHLHMSGNLDIQAMAKDPKNAELHFNLMPSGAIDVSTEMQLDFYAATAGLKHAATVHTSTGVDIKFKTLNGKGFDLNIDTPLSKQEIITAKSELFATTRDRGQVQTDTALQFNVPRRDYHGCFDQLSPLIGLTFCGDLGFPYEGVPKKGPFFPLDGPAKLVVRVEKEDVSLNGYHLHALYSNEVASQRSLEVTFSTPGSQTDRTVSFLFEGKSEPDYELKLSLKSPIKSATVSGKLINNNQEHSLTGLLQIDDQEYLARLGLQVTGDAATHAEYKPVLEYSGPGPDGKASKGTSEGQQVYLDGTITMDRNKEAKQFKYTFTKLCLTTSSRKYELDGFVSHEPNSYDTDLTFKYDNLAQFVQVKANGKRTSDVYHTYVEAQTSQYPELAFAVNYDLKHGVGLLENKLKVHHGTDLKNEVNCLTISQAYKFVGGKESKDFELTTKNLVSYPALELRVHFDAEATRKSFHYLLEGGMEEHRLSSELTLKHSIPGPDGQENSRDPGGYEFVFKVGAAGQNVLVSSKRQIVTADTSKLTVEFEMQPKGHNFKLVSDLTHRFENKDIKLKLTSVLTVTGHPHTYTLCTGMQSNINSCEGHVKLSKDNDDFYIVKMQVARGDPTSGSFEILLKGYLQGTATFTHSKSSREGNIKAEFQSPKLDRKMKVEGTVKPGAKLTVTDANLDILLDADNNAENKIHFETSVDMNKDGRTFDSKSVLLLTKQKFNLAFKGVIPNRSPTDAGILMKADSNLELPSGQKISSFSELAQLQPKDGNGLIAKMKFDDGQGAKLNYEGRYSRVAGFVLPTYDVLAKLNLVAPSKKDLMLQFNVENRDLEGHQAVDYKFDASGSVLPQAIHSSFSVELVETPHYHIKANYGDKLAAEVEAKYSLKDPVDKSAEINCQLKTNIEGYEVIKTSENFKSHKEQDLWKMSCQHKVEVNGARKMDSHMDVELKRENDLCQGSSEWTLFLGSEETEPRVWTNKYEHKGVSPLRANLNTPQQLSVSSVLKQGSTKFGLVLKSERPGDGTASGVANLEAFTPVQGYEHMQINVDHKSEKGNKQITSKVDYILNKKQHFEVLGNVDLSEANRSFGVNLKRQGASNPIFDAYAAYKRVSSSELSGELRITASESKPRSLAAAGAIKYPGGLDDFEVELSIDSQTLKLEKVKVEVTNKPGGNKGRQINVIAKSPEKTLFEGSTNYQRKEEAGSIVYEGEGSFSVGDDSRTSSFRLVTKALSAEKHGENGFDTSLTAELTGASGKQTLDVQNKLTDKTLRVYDKYCHHDGKCSYLEISNTVKITDITDINIENKLALDIQQLSGVPAFEVHGKFQRNKLEFEHRISATLGKDEAASTYVYQVFIKKPKAGVHLTLPKRTIALDVVLTTPEDSGKARQSDTLRTYKLEVTAGLDIVRQPTQKLTLLSTMTVNKGKDGTIYTSDLKISHPSLSRELLMKSKNKYGAGQVILDSSLSLDIFAKKGQAIEITLKNERIPVDGGFNLTSVFSVTSKGQNIDTKITSHAIATKSELGFGCIAVAKDSKLGTAESGILFSLSLEKMLVLVRAPTCELLRLSGECKRSKNEDTKANFELVVLQTLALEGETIGYRHAKYQAYNKNTPNDRIVYTGFMELEQKLELLGEHTTGGNNNKLFHLLVSFEPESFLKTENSVDGDNLKTAVDKLQLAVKAAGERLSVLVADTTKDTTARVKSSIETFKKSQFNFKPLIDRCKQEYKELQEELKTDASVQELVDLVKNVVSGLAKAVSKFIETMTVHLEKISARVQEISGKISELLGKLSPVLTEAAGKVSKAIATAFTTILEIFTSLTAKILGIIKDNSEEIQKFLSLIADFVKEQSKVVGQLLAEVKVYIEEFVKTVIQQLKSLPLVDNIKERYKEVYELLLSRFEGVLSELADTLKEIVPTPELRELVDSIVQYIDKKLKKENVDEVAEMEKIAQQFLKAMRALLQSVTSAAPPGMPAFNMEALLKLATSPLSVESLQSIPKWFNMRLSIIDLLSSDDLPSAGDLLATYSMPRHLDDLTPPHRAFGQISGSQHFFTFDGDHFTLKGDCQYLLARDFDDGNFSLAVDLAGGKLRSVSLMDQQDTVELRADHSVLLNGQAVELPLHENDMAIFRTLHGVHIKNKAGVYVTCDLHHELCSFAVNGFYFGKTRGLLGTISNEKYDDMALPNGKVASTVNQFANAYMLSESCKTLTPVEHKHTNHKECGYAFSSQQSISACFRFVDPTPFRQACDDAKDEATTKEEILKAVCDASVAYIAKCRDATFLHPSLPANCAQCALGKKQTDIGGTAAVKAPDGKADIVILVEQVAENEEAFTNFLSPLVTSLITDLKDKFGISDASVSLIGYGGPGQNWPALFTTNGKFAFDGKRPQQLKFGAKTVETPANDQHPIVTFLERARDWAKLESAATPLGQAFQQVVEFPFRADAAKSVILLRHSPCRKSASILSLQPLQMLYAREFFRDRGIVVAFAQPVDISSPAGDKKLTGFDSDNALTYSKKAVDPSLRSEIDYSADSCASFIDLVQPTVFSMKNFKDIKQNQRKQFVQSASTRLSTLLGSSEVTQSCECRLHEGLHTEARCSVTANKVATSKKSAKP